MVSLLFLAFLWKPYFLFRWGFKISVIRYWKLYLKCFAAGAIAVVACTYIASHLPIVPESNFLYLILYAVVIALIFGSILLVVSCCINRAMIQCVRRFILIIKPDYKQ